MRKGEPTAGQKYISQLTMIITNLICNFVLAKQQISVNFQFDSNKFWQVKIAFESNNDIVRS